MGLRTWHQAICTNPQALCTARLQTRVSGEKSFEINLVAEGLLTRIETPPFGECFLCQHMPVLFQGSKGQKYLWAQSVGFYTWFICHFFSRKQIWMQVSNIQKFSYGQVTVQSRSTEAGSHLLIRHLDKWARGHYSEWPVFDPQCPHPGPTRSDPWQPAGVAPKAKVFNIWSI